MKENIQFLVPLDSLIAITENRMDGIHNDRIAVLWHELSIIQIQQLKKLI